MCYKTCPHCGANLDPCETCEDCKNTKNTEVNNNVKSHDSRNA